MSLPVPLSVRLVTASADKTITRDLRELSFRSTVPGGFASCSISLDRPLSVQPSEIDYYGRLVVCDTRTGVVAWEGRLEDPGRSAGRDGQVWDLAAVGPSAHTKDRSVPLVYVDRDLQAFQQVDKASPAATAAVAGDPGDAAGTRQALVLAFPRGVGMSPTARAVMRYSRLMQTGQKLARFDYDWDTGLSSPNLTVEGFTRTDGVLATGEIATTNAWSTAGGTNDGIVVTDFPSGRNTVEFRSIYSNGAAPVPNDDWWSSVYNIAIRAMLLSKTGSDVTTGYTTWTVYAHEVVADLLGRLLTRYDGAGASIATTSFAIEQIAYIDGATPAKILDDLMALEPGYYWAAWESTVSSGNPTYRFEWVAWPTNVRYEAGIVDGYRSTGSADGLYDAVRVRWRDSTGATRSTRRTQTVPQLAAAGITREAQIDLGEEVGSQTTADRAGDSYLADHLTPPNAGQLTIARPVYDRTAGRMVQPWEIRPGNLIRVRGILPRPDSLNPTGRDGVSVMRIVGVDYRASDAAAVLELDSPAPSVARAIADLAAANTNRRR